MRVFALIALVFVMALSGCDLEDTGSTGTASERTSSSNPKSAQEAFENCVSPWDGNHEGFEDKIRALLNDPDSMSTHGTYYNSSDSISDGVIRIRLNYSAANAFGGKVRTDAFADMNIRTCVVDVIDYGF